MIQSGCLVPARGRPALTRYPYSCNQTMIIITNSYWRATVHAHVHVGIIPPPPRAVGQCERVAKKNWVGQLAIGWQKILFATRFSKTEASVLKRSFGFKPKLRFCSLLGGNNSFWVAIKKVGHPMAKRVAKSPFCHRVCTIY